jgi:hypothetical protein
LLALRIALGVAFAATFGVALLIWWAVLRPARLYQGESGVKPDRYGNFLRSEWYDSGVRNWLAAARILYVAGFLFFVMLGVALAS